MNSLVLLLLLVFALMQFNLTAATSAMPSKVLSFLSLFYLFIFSYIIEITFAVIFFVLISLIYIRIVEELLLENNTWITS